MALDGEQHVGEAPENVRPDRFALVAARHVGHHVPRNAEMVRPEPHQPFGEADFGEQRGIEPRSDFFEKILPFGGRRGINLGAAAGFAGSAILPASSLMPWRSSAASRSASFWARCARTFFACRAACASKPAREACALVSKSGLLMAPMPGRSSSASSAPRGSEAIAAIEPGRGPRPNRCRANAASRVRSSTIGLTHNDDVALCYVQ